MYKKYENWAWIGGKKILKGRIKKETATFIPKNVQRKSWESQTETKERA